MSQTRSRSRSLADGVPLAGRESGFTIVEILIVALLGTLLLGAVYQMMIVQEQGFRVQRAVVSTQDNMRTTLDVLATELREVNATTVGAEGSDVATIAPESIRFRAFRKIGIVCAATLGSALDVHEIGYSFAAGDSILVFVDGDPAAAGDDSWTTMNVAATAAVSAACADNWGYTRQSLTGLSSASFGGIRRGAPVRAFVWTTYGIVQDAAGEWVLARRETGSTWVPLLGPLASPTNGGLRFRYYDANGALTTNPAQVARIEVTVRGESRTVAGATATGTYTDTLTTQIYLRNN
ncbi:MAG: hypothetical protein ACRELD_03690 [Longimicrobiales bacterium]